MRGFASRQIQSRPTSTIFESSASPVSGDVRLWLKSDLLGLSEGATVSAWPDSSQYGNNFSTVWGGAPPRTAPIFSEGGVYCRNTSDEGLVGFAITSPQPPITSGFSVIVTQPWTVVVTCKSKSTANASRRAIQGYPGNFVIGPFGGKWKAFDGSFIDDGNVDLDVKHTFVYRQDSAVIGEFLKDGVSVGTNTPGWGTDGSGNANYNFSICLGGSGLYPEPFDGIIYEVLVWARRLGDAEMNAVVSYLRTKWSV